MQKWVIVKNILKKIIYIQYNIKLKEMCILHECVLCKAKYGNKIGTLCSIYSNKITYTVVNYNTLTNYITKNWQGVKFAVCNI